MKNIVALFERPEQAQSALRDLEAAGYTRDEVSLVTPRIGDTSSVDLGTHEAAVLQHGSQLGENTMAGAFFGGIGGTLLLGAAALMIPGLGPIVAAGPLATLFGGIVSGAAGGAAIGALKEQGIVDGEADVYAKAVRQGGTLVMVHATDERADGAAAILDRHHPVDIDKDRTTYEGDRFDETQTHSNVVRTERRTEYPVGRSRVYTRQD